MLNLRSFLPFGREELILVFNKKNSIFQILTILQILHILVFLDQGNLFFLFVKQTF